MNKEDEIQWEYSTVKNALKYIDLVESGCFIPDEIIRNIGKRKSIGIEEKDIVIQGKIQNDRIDKVLKNLTSWNCVPK